MGPKAASSHSPGSVQTSELGPTALDLSETGDERGSLKPALLYAVTASFLFALMNAAAKFLSSHLTVPEVVFYRGLIGVALTVWIMRRNRIPFKVKNWPLLVSRGVFGGVSLLMAFLAISSIALAEASFLAHLSPLFTVCLGFIILQERMPQGFTPLFLLSCLGALLVAAPWKAELHSFYATVGVLGAILASSASLAIRQLSKDHNNYTIMLGFLGVATVLPIPFIDWTRFSIPKGWAAVVTIFLGTVSFLAQYCLTQAYRLEKAGLVATARYVGILFNIFLGYLIWREVPDWSSFLGGSLILVSCLALPRLSRETEAAASRPS